MKKAPTIHQDESHLDKPIKTREPALQSICRELRNPAEGLKNEVEARKMELSARLKKATKPCMVQVSPGRYIPDNREIDPGYTLARWEANGDGTFRLAVDPGRLVRFTYKLARLMGFHGKNMLTLYRLSRAGFIEIVNVAPKCPMINIDSWFNHLKRCAEDPEFWDKGRGNREEYRKSMF
jgi:hypothetical protein